MRPRRILSQAGSRLAVWLGVLTLSGLLAATLVRMAPGFGMDERLLDPRLTDASRQAIEQQGREQNDVLGYYIRYYRRLAEGDLGQSISLGRPVRELLAERLAVSARSAAAGLALAWGLNLAVVAGLELRPGRGFRPAQAAAAIGSGALLSIPAAVVALGCAYAGGTPAVAIAVILLPRLFRYAHSVVAAAAQAPHVLAAEAMGLGGWRILGLHVVAPVWPELAALAGVSVSMAIGATIPVEALCDSPGIGNLVWQAALSRDVPVLVNVTLLITALTTGANLLADTVRAAQD
jgi:peptide/nickel transport system permease protein